VGVACRGRGVLVGVACWWGGRRPFAELRAGGRAESPCGRGPPGGNSRNAWSGRVWTVGRWAVPTGGWRTRTDPV